MYDDEFASNPLGVFQAELQRAQSPLYSDPLKPYMYIHVYRGKEPTAMGQY